MAINGTAVAVTSVGGLLLYSAVKGTGIGDTARSLLSGQGVAVDDAGNPLGGVDLPGPQTTVQDFINQGYPQPKTQSVSGGGVAVAALNFAISQEGKPYKWGGVGPNSYDCSGLIVASYKAAGVKLPRLTTSSFLVSPKFVAVPKFWDSIQPGDLIWPYPGHVVFALDPSSHEIVEAPRPGKNVRQANYSEYTRIYAVRRYKGDGTTSAERPPS